MAKILQNVHIDIGDKDRMKFKNNETYSILQIDRSEFDPRTLIFFENQEHALEFFLKGVEVIEAAIREGKPAA